MIPFLQYSEFNKWANELLLSIAVKLPDEKLDQEIISSFPSLRKTFYHVWGAEHIWLRRLRGEPHPDWPSKTFSGTFSEAKKIMLANDDDFIAFVKGLTDEKLMQNFTYKNLEGQTLTNPIWQSVHHCMNHSTYHRGQIVTMLRQAGVSELPSTDFITYCRVG